MKASTYYHTLKYLKLTQLYGQFVFRFKRPRIKFTTNASQKKVNAKWTLPILELPQLSLPDRLTFLNQEKNITDKDIWNSGTGDEKLWRYNLHYFDFVNSKNFSNEGSWSASIIHRWIKENPPVNGCGWDPYPISLRVVNWVKWILNGNIASQEMLDSLYLQSRYLNKRIEFHILGNHILANAKALLFAGLFFNGKESEAWFKKGLKLYNKQMKAQVLEDGGHFELSPMYHAIILEDLLDVINIFKTFDKEIDACWLKQCKKMFFWLQAMSHLDGDIAFFNDAAANVAPTLSQLHEYSNRLGLNNKLSNLDSVQSFSQSGYCRIQKNNMLLLADIGNIGASYQPGHGHADVLSFELSLGSQRMIVNSGTSTYSESDERLRQRSTHAHNTLVVDDKNSSHVWKSFRVGRRARVRDIKIQKLNHFLLLKASHDGYYHADKIIHTRLWKIENNKLLIEDSVTGEGIHAVDIYFHFHPEIQVNQVQSNSFDVLTRSGLKIASIKMNNDSQLVESTYHPEFNVSIANKKIVTKVYQPLPAVFQTTIEFND